MPRSGPALLLVLAACGRADGRAALSEPTIDTLAGGIVQVTNPGPTRWADTSGWRIVEERVIAPAEGSPGELASAGNLVADAAGNVYVMQQGPVTIKVFGPDGQWLRNIGREGDGPGEFRNGMLGIVGDTLFVQDPNNQRLSVFLTDGTFLATHLSQCCWFTSRVNVLADGRALILGPPPPDQQDLARGAYYATRMDGTVTDTILMPGRDEDDAHDYWEVTRRSGQGVSISRINIPMQPNDEDRIRPDGMIVRGRTDAYRFRLGRRYDDSVRVFSANAPTIPVSDAQRDSAYRATLDQQRDDWRDAFAEVAKLSDIPSSWPAWTGMTVDRENNLWVALPGDRGPVSRLEVFSPDGILLGRVAAPAHAGMVLNGFWAGERVYSGGEDDDGLPIIRVFRIEKPAR